MRNKIKTKLLLGSLMLLFVFGCSKNNGELLFIEPETNDGFSFPYFLFIPDDISLNEDVFIVVELNNSGFTDDDLQKHIEKAKRTASSDFYLGNYSAMSLNYPLIVPVFPRSKTLLPRESFARLFGNQQLVTSN